MLTELFAQLTEEGSVSVYTAGGCMTALEGVLVTHEYSILICGSWTELLPDLTLCYFH